MIGGCEDNQCLTVLGHISACEKDGQVVISASLSVNVEFDTWLGRKSLKDTIPSFNLIAGTKTQTLYVHDLQEGTVYIKSRPDMVTGRVALWAEYVLNNSGFCAYIKTDQLALSATPVSKAFTESDSSNTDSFPVWAIIIIAIGGVLCLGIAFYSGRLSVGEEKMQTVDLETTTSTRGSVMGSQSFDRDSILLDDQVQTTDVGAIEVEDNQNDV